MSDNPIDSLARLAKMDVGKQIVPYFTSAITRGPAVTPGSRPLWGSPGVL